MLSQGNRKIRWIGYLLGSIAVLFIAIFCIRLGEKGRSANDEAQTIKPREALPPEALILPRDNRQPIEKSVRRDFQTAEVATSFEGADLSAMGHRLRYERGGLQSWYSSLWPRLVTSKPGRDAVLEAYAYLDSNFYQQSELDLLKLNGLKNDLLDKLMQLNPMPSDLGTRLLAMYLDARQDAVWRDYCIQHFAPYYQARWPDAARAADDGEASRFRAVLRQAANDPEGTMAGSALIGLEVLSRPPAAFDRNEVGTLALNMAVDKSRPMNIRATAIQICGLMGKKEVLSTARSLIEETQNVSCLIPAIGAIGSLGSANDASLLKSLAASSVSPYVRHAAQSAFQRLSTKKAESI